LPRPRPTIDQVSDQIDPEETLEEATNNEIEETTTENESHDPTETDLEEMTLLLQWESERRLT